jgi:hypothetical protein
MFRLAKFSFNFFQLRIGSYKLSTEIDLQTYFIILHLHLKTINSEFN